MVDNNNNSIMNLSTYMSLYHVFLLSQVQISNILSANTVEISCESSLGLQRLYC